MDRLRNHGQNEFLSEQKFDPFIHGSLITTLRIVRDAEQPHGKLAIEKAPALKLHPGILETDNGASHGESEGGIVGIAYQANEVVASRVAPDGHPFFKLLVVRFERDREAHVQKGQTPVDNRKVEFGGAFAARKPQLSPRRYGW